jgi:hypothetical protein
LVVAAVLGRGSVVARTDPERRRCCIGLASRATHDRKEPEPVRSRFALRVSPRSGEYEESRRNPDVRLIGYEIEDLRIAFSSSGDVAWFSCRLDDIGAWQSPPASWIRTRWTGMLRKSHGRWRMVQMHLSSLVQD